MIAHIGNGKRHTATDRFWSAIADGGTGAGSDAKIYALDSMKTEKLFIPSTECVLMFGKGEFIGSSVPTAPAETLAAYWHTPSGEHSRTHTHTHVLTIWRLARNHIIPKLVDMERQQIVSMANAIHFNLILKFGTQVQHFAPCAHCGINCENVSHLCLSHSLPSPWLSRPSRHL